jgi:formylglycine-generating enzyme required for sulfatase activity
MSRVAPRVAQYMAPLCALVLAVATGCGCGPPKRFTETIEGSKEKAEGKKSAFEMVLIPGGKFTMGSPDAENGHRVDEGPVHEVEISPFYLCTTETTLELSFIYYEELCRPRGAIPLDRLANRFGKDRLPDVGAPWNPKAVDNLALADIYSVDAIATSTPVYGDLTMGWGAGKRPFIGPTWLNAANFCRWLSQKTGRHYRLPTEAEWEYACRAGSKTAYACGDKPADLKDYAWFEDNSDEQTHPVAQKKPNAWGLYDMHGNVREWCHDFYDPDAYAANARLKPCRNPLGPKLPVGEDIEQPHRRIHVARGGSWQDPPVTLRSAARAKQEPSWTVKDPEFPKSRWWLPEQGHIGFRVACDADSVK